MNPLCLAACTTSVFVFVSAGSLQQLCCSVGVLLHLANRSCRFRCHYALAPGSSCSSSLQPLPSVSARFWSLAGMFCNQISEEYIICTVITCMHFQFMYIVALLHGDDSPMHVPTPPLLLCAVDTFQ